MEDSQSRGTPSNMNFTPKRAPNNLYRSYGAGAGLTSVRKGKLTSLKLPTSREVPKARDLSEKDPEQISKLTEKNWNLYYVTPLYKFLYTGLKSYSRQLSAFIVAEKQKGIAVEVGLETNFKVNFSIIQGLTEIEEDAEAVFIQICSKPKFATEATAETVVWSGWLSCVNGNTEYLSSLPPEFTCLPLFCANGAETMTALVTTWFQRTFDCNFGPLRIGSNSLCWLAAMWTGCEPEMGIRYLKLSWSLPCSPPLNVSFTVHPGDAWELWRSIRQDQVRMTIEEVDQFMSCIESHFFRHFKIHLSAGELIDVSTSLGSAHRDGKIKLMSSHYMPGVLTLLTESAFVMMPI
ncbi:centromere protein L [Huso huso]|uniref:Centromere protein L n=1 Tax=Huso huso TaxID=61971 RepID=A0ABR0ZHF1_HUSHU